MTQQPGTHPFGVLFFSSSESLNSLIVVIVSCVATKDKYS